MVLSYLLKRRKKEKKQVNKRQTGIVNCTLDPDWDFLVGSWFFLMSVPVPDLEFLKYPDCDLYTHAHGSLLTWLNDSLICTTISCNMYSIPEAIYISHLESTSNLFFTVWFWIFSSTRAQRLSWNQLIKKPCRASYPNNDIPSPHIKKKQKKHRLISMLGHKVGYWMSIILCPIFMLYVVAVDGPGGTPCNTREPC